MNLLLFNTPWERCRLEPEDPRALHVRGVLRVSAGAELYVGFVNGLRARARVVSLEPDGAVVLQRTATEAVPPPLPITLLVGLCRPHTAKRILFESASLGVAGLHFFEAQRSEPSYAASRLWQGEAWVERLRLGAEQAFTTRLPEVAMHPDLQSAVTALGGAARRLAFDNYEAASSLRDAFGGTAPEHAVLGLGPERGWAGEERELLRRNGWILVGLGAHILRSETACVAAVATTASALGWWP